MIGTVTLNPSVDRRYTIEELAKNTVNRTDDYAASAGGKGLNVARVLRMLGEDVAGFGFIGGETGSFIQSELEKMSVQNQFMEIDGTTRTCLNIIDANGDNIEVLEQGPTISKADAEKFIEAFDAVIENYDFFTMSGSLPKGLDQTIYSDLIERANAKGKRVILDTSGDVLLKNLSAKPFLIKPNEEELSDITGIELNSEANIKEAAQVLLDKGAKNIAISLGSKGMYFYGEEGNYKVEIPSIKVQNTVGSGDSSVAGFAYALTRGDDIESALKYANACGMSNASQLGTGEVDPKQVEELVKEIKVSKLD